MKKNKLNLLYKYALVLIVIVSMIACKKNIFDKKDLQGVDPDIWNLESATNLYINKTYDLVMPNWPVPGAIHNTSDESNNALTTLLYGTLIDNSVTDIASNNTSSSNNQYFTIRRINLAISGIEDGSLPRDVKSKLKGQLYFFRAFMYFNLVKLYGGVPLVLKSQDINEDQLNVGRSKTSVCIDQICTDLDSCYGLPNSWPLSSEGGKITKLAALSLKGKVLMYWASPQFNPTAPSAAKWTRAYTACKVAYDSCIANGVDLLSVFSNIFIDESATNKERILWRTYDNITVNPGRGTNTENITRPVSETTSSAGSGSNQPTWNLVQAFVMKNGLPISDPTSGYNPVLFWVNRDPRFEATIAYNGSVWPLSGKTGRKQWNYVGVGEDNANQSKTGFYCKKICNPSIPATAALYNSNSGGGSGMDWIEMRFAEVLLNLAECANAVGNLAESQTLVAKLRTRAGIDKGTNNYGLSVVIVPAKMDTLIWNERQVEFAMEGKRYDDLRRTRTFHMLTGKTRDGYKWTAKAPFTNAILEALTLGYKPRDTININNQASYNAAFTTATFPLDTTSPINFPTTYYFYALPTGFLTSSIAIEQTIGWPGGTFDPLQ